RCGVVERVGEHEAAGARHVLRHDRGITRDEARHMAGERTRIDVIPATGAVADVKIDRFALVEVRGTLRVSERDRTEREDRGGADQSQNTHVILLPAVADHASPPSVRISTSQPSWHTLHAHSEKDTSKLLTLVGLLDCAPAACSQELQIRHTRAILPPT